MANLLSIINVQWIWPFLPRDDKPPRKTAIALFQSKGCLWDSPAHLYSLITSVQTDHPSTAPTGCNVTMSHGHSLHTVAPPLPQLPCTQCSSFQSTLIHRR